MKAKKLLLLLVVGLGLASCGKYEEGPGFSLRSKKARVANEWKVGYAYDREEQVEITTDFSGETWAFTKDGEFFEKENGELDKAGTWEFISDKEEIALIFTNDIDKYTILKLKENEMWLLDKEEELHLVPVE